MRILALDLNQLFSMEKNYNTNLPLAFLFSNNFSTIWLYSSPPATPESFVSFSFTATQIPLLERSLSSSSKAWKKWGKICYWKVTEQAGSYYSDDIAKKIRKMYWKKKWILGGEVWEPNLSYQQFERKSVSKSIAYKWQVIVQYL